MTAAAAFRRRFSKRHLLSIYSERIKGSGAIGLDRIRPASLDRDLTKELSLIIDKVQAGQYNFTAYKEKLILKGASAPPRQISIPTARDRIVLRALAECLADVFPGARLTLPQMVIESLKQALLSGKYTEYAKIDLKAFYPSIPHRLIEASLRQRVRKAQLRVLIQRAISTPTVPEAKGGRGAERATCGVPQGLAISNLLAEISLQDVDEPLKGRDDLWYRRYVDDILVLASTGQAQGIAQSLIDDLCRLGLKPHEMVPGSKSKVAPLTDPFSFLGYQIEEGNVLVRPESILRFESSIAKIFTAYRHKLQSARTPADKQRALAFCRWKLNLRITGCVFDGKRLGWVAYFSQISTTSQLRAINHTVRKLTARFGLSADIRPKSLIKTFYELRRGEKSTHRYIPNFDNLTLQQMREHLAMWLGADAYTLKPADVERRFAIKINRAVRELEEDVAQTS